MGIHVDATTLPTISSTLVTGARPRASPSGDQVRDGPGRAQGIPLLEVRVGAEPGGFGEETARQLTKVTSRQRLAARIP